MRAVSISLFLLAIDFAAPVNAALWSSTNAVVQVGGTTTLSISLTGDQRTVAAQVDIAIPVGFRAVAHNGRNGGHCNVIASGRTLRVLIVDSRLLPLPAIAQPYCDLTITAIGYAPPWFTMSGDLCLDALSASYRCERDRGFVTITAP